jgi:PAS domain S-box-containing protein
MPFDTQAPIRILHLEDSDDDAELIGHKLKAEMPCEITVVSSRERFEAAVAQGSFDLVLCDHNVPGYAGLAALRTARRTMPDTPVIMISGSIGEEQAVESLHMGATDYLLKARLERLAPAVTRAIHEAQEHRKHRQSEVALQERERRLSSIFESVADMVFYVDVDDTGAYRYATVNPAFIAATGLRHDQVIGKRIEEVLPSADTTKERFAEAIRERRVVRWERTVDFPRGRVIGEVSIAPVFDADGRCTNLVGAVHDVTEHRQLEAQLRQAQKMESIGLLAGGIAHDFNNLLTVINGLTELVSVQIAQGEHSKVESDLLEIRRAGDRAAALTGQLLAFSRKHILQPAVLDLHAVVSDMGKMLERLLGEDVHLSMPSPGGQARIKSDRGELEQVILNLAVNARDAMPRGGTLSIEIRTLDVDASDVDALGTSVTPGPYVAVAVRDTGTGIDESTRRQIFEPFFTTKEPGRGTGLGLSTVYGIVRQSGGFIRVDSEPGRGSCFTVFFPRTAEDAAAAGIPAPPQDTRGTETILVVEDGVGLRHLMTRVLEPAGYRVLTAGNGEEAFHILQQHQHRLDLMITDIVMPGMSGRRLAERLGEVRPETKVLFMSGYTDDVILKHGVLTEGVPFINKPFSPKDLLRKVRQLLDAP